MRQAVKEKTEEMLIYKMVERNFHEVLQYFHELPIRQSAVNIFYFKYYHWLNGPSAFYTESKHRQLFNEEGTS